jgi:uncharacterized protein (TIGR02145 family)
VIIESPKSSYYIRIPNHNQMKTKILLAFLIGIVCVSYGQQTSKKVALVIGVQHYTILAPLRNSLSDAKDLSQTLISKGFQVETLLDPKTSREIKDAIIRYKNSMQDVVGGVGIIFYAGHGMQYEGNNYLIPTTAKLELSSDLDDQCLKMNSVMSVLNASNKSLNILLLDACRTIPSFNRDTEQGWTKVNAPRGSIVVFAAEAGKVASDGDGKNGLFTSKLLKEINEPGLNINEVFKRVKQDVFTESNEKQLPSVEDNSIGGDFYFTKKPSEQSNSMISSAIKHEQVKVKENIRGPFDYGYGPSDAPVVTVGSQVWLVKNLNIDHFANGEAIREAKTAEEWKRANEEKEPAWCFFNNDPTNGRTYGRLYNWYAISDPRGLAPWGCHIPSADEWDNLARQLAATGIEVNKELKTDYGTKYLTYGVGVSLKSHQNWEGKNGNNSSGFSGLPCGLRFAGGEFDYFGKQVAWWTSSESSLDKSFSFRLSYLIDDLSKTNSRKGDGYSVRCIKD